jgi:hypothetical protein
MCTSAYNVGTFTPENFKKRAAAAGMKFWSKQ